MKHIFFFLYALGIGLILTGVYFRFANVKKPTAEIRIPFIGSQFSLENAPSQSLKGKIISMTGAVFWMDRVATQSSKLQGTETIQQGEEIQTQDNGNIIIQFNKATEIDVAPKTQIDIIQTLPDDLVFNQASGSAIYKKTGNFPVSIRALHLLVENGGQVSIIIDSLAPKITINSTAGVAGVAFNTLDNISSVLKISEGKSYLFNDDTRQGALK